MPSALRGFALQSLGALKGLAMADKKEGKTEAPPSPLKVVAANVRQAMCTHTTVTRLYGNFTCSHCGKLSGLGWVYRCTQDYNGQLPEWEGGLSPKTTKEPPGPFDGAVGDASRGALGGADGAHLSIESLALATDSVVAAKHTISLSPWVEKAILKGQYSQEQVQKLREQRENVKEKIKESEALNKQYQYAKYRGSSQAARRHSHRHTIVTGFGITIPTFANENEDEGSSPQPTALKMFPECPYRSCQSCRRPLMRDRSWTCIDHAHASHYDPIPNFKFDNRPVTDATVVREIGLWELASEEEQESDTVSSYSSTEFDRVAAEQLFESDEQQYEQGIHLQLQHLPKPLRRLSTSIQRRLRKGLRNLAAATEKRSTSAGARLSTDSKKPRQHSMGASERRRLNQTMAGTSTDESEAGFMSPLERQDRIRRPSYEERTDGRGWDMVHHGANEVHTSDGVAVTEEAVDLGTADVITQA